MHKFVIYGMFKLTTTHCLCVLWSGVINSYIFLNVDEAVTINGICYCQMITEFVCPETNIINLA